MRIPLLFRAIRRMLAISGQSGRFAGARNLSDGRACYEGLTSLPLSSQDVDVVREESRVQADDSCWFA